MYRYIIQILRILFYSLFLSLAFISISFTEANTLKNYDKNIKRNAYAFTYNLCSSDDFLPGMSNVLMKKSFEGGFMMTSENPKAEEDFHIYLKDVFQINPLLSHLFMSDGFYKALKDCFGNDSASKEIFLNQLFGADFLGRVSGVLLSVFSYSAVRFVIIKLFPYYGLRFIKYLDRLLIAAGVIAVTYIGYAVYSAEGYADQTEDSLEGVFKDNLILEKRTLEKLPLMKVKIFINNILINQQPQLRYPLERLLENTYLADLPQKTLRDLCEIKSIYEGFLEHEEFC